MTELQTPKQPVAVEIVTEGAQGRGALLNRAPTVSRGAAAVIDGLQGSVTRARHGVAALAPKIPILWLSFVLGVVAPSLCVIFYLTMIASDQYVGEARLSVRSAAVAGGKVGSGIGAAAALSAGSMPQIADQDAHIVAEYLRSRAAVEDLGRQLDLQSLFRFPGLDFWARLKPDPTAEELQAYWSRMLRASVDGPSGIVTIQVRAFRAQDAQALAEACVRIAEALVNRLSDRARMDALRKAEEETRRAEGLLQQALRDLRAFRDKEGILDPGSAATSTSQLLLGALAERVRLQTDMFVMSRAMAPDAPTVKALKDRIDGIEGQIEQLRGELTNKSAQARTVASALVRFEELEIQRIFAAKLFDLAQSGLERARTRAESQQLYLTVFVPPYLPEEARYPERLTMSLVIPLVLLVIWSIFALLAAAIEDHLI